MYSCGYLQVVYSTRIIFATPSLPHHQPEILSITAYQAIDSSYLLIILLYILLIIKY